MTVVYLNIERADNFFKIINYFVQNMNKGIFFFHTLKGKISYLAHFFFFNYDPISGLCGFPFIKHRNQACSYFVLLKIT